MNKVSKKLTVVMLTSVLGYSGFAQSADIVIGVPNWPSVAATADVLKVVLEDNLGIEVELQNATNPIVFEAMDTGSMQVHPEVWLPNQQNLHDTYVKNKGTVSMNPNGVVSFTGMCVTEGTAKRTGIKNITDLNDPDMAKNFDTDGDGKGNMWIGASGWASTTIEKIRGKSYGYDETMNLMEMDETLALAQVDAAVAKKEDIVFMCYTPHHMFSLHKLVVLDEPAHDPAKWKIIQPTDDPNWLENSDAPVAWSAPTLHIHFATSLKKSNPEVARLLSNIKFTTDHLSAMTYALVIEKQDAAEFAQKWVKDNSVLVDSWIQ